MLCNIIGIYKSAEPWWRNGRCGMRHEEWWRGIEKRSPTGILASVQEKASREKERKREVTRERRKK